MGWYNLSDTYIAWLEKSWTCKWICTIYGKWESISVVYIAKYLSIKYFKRFQVSYVKNVNFILIRRVAYFLLRFHIMLVLKLICIFFQCLPYLLLLQTNFLRKVVGRGKRLGLQMCWLLPRYYATLLRIYNSKTVTGEIIALETKKPWYVDILSYNRGPA